MKKIDFDISIKNKKIKKLVNMLVLISFFICISGIITIWIYNIYYISMYLLQTGIEIFRCGILIGVFSSMYGIFFDKYLECK